MVNLLGNPTWSRVRTLGWICSVGLAVIAFSIFMGRSPLVTFPVDTEEQGHWEVFLEWGMQAPAGDVSPLGEGGGSSFIHGAVVPVGLDVTTQYLQQLMTAGTEHLFYGSGEDAAGLSTITHLHFVPTPEPDRFADQDDEPAPEPVEPVGVQQDPSPVTAVTHHDDATTDGEGDLQLDPDASTAPSIIPLPVDGAIVVPYGWVECATLGEWIFHPGVDIEASEGTEVRSVTEGRVDSVASTTCMGVTVRVVCADLTFVYSGMGGASVNPGDSVSADMVLGTIGPSPLREVALGPHLHFEVRNVQGEPVELELTAEGIRLCR